MTQVKKNSLSRLLLFQILVSTATLTLSGAAQEAPPGLEDIIQQFNFSNGVGGSLEEEEVDDYGLATYDKSRTQFDGVTHEMQVTYLSMGLDQGVEIPILSTGTRDENIDFTIMLWFKVDEAFFTRSVPGGVPPQIMYLFSFEDSVACFFTDTLTLMCDSWDRRKLQIAANQVTPGIWYHLTLASSKDGESYLLIQDSHNDVAVDTVYNFGFRQSVFYNWKACIGDCTADYGFFGGIREVVLFDKFVTQEEARRAKNLILTYDSSIKAYFRFQDLHNKFEKDEFVDWPWLTFKNKPSREFQYIGVDIIPNDVCPSIFSQISALRHSEDSRLATYEIDADLPQNEYGYTMSMTIQVNETACTTFDPAVAAKDCNLAKLEGVFMLYLVGRNTVRFHFFASKNYYESASSPIFIPYDQWVTIQLSIEHYDGYTIVIADQNGNAFYRTKVDQNMQEMWPENKLSLFRAFDGYVEHFYLAKSAKTLSPFFAMDFRGDTNAIVNVEFTKESFNNGFVNKGSQRSKVKVSGDVKFENIFFEVPSEGGALGGTLADTEPMFDGIACNDRHMTTQLNSNQSYIKFMTPPLTEWSSANTIEFWFKVEDPAIYFQDALLFSIVSNENNPQLYYHVYIQKGDLKCAPFGNTSFKDPVITFTEFKEENADTYGWWHVSCSYSFQQTARATLYNTKIGVKALEDTMIGLPKFYPTNSLMASFGRQLTTNPILPGASNVLVKEFRFWNKQMNLAEIESNRYRQIDPTKLDNELLLIYLRMATGSSLMDNFAARNQMYTFQDFNIELNDLSFVEDFIEQEKYAFNENLNAVVPQRVRTYHTVCPVHSYYMKQYCYNEPVNQAVLAIFPDWDSLNLQLNWRMTLYHSSTIDHELITFLTDTWRADDTILNDFFESNDSVLDHLVPASVLRHESEYRISAELTNESRTFVNSVSVKFAPSKCKWLSVVGSTVTGGTQFLQVSPGTEDVSFQLQLQRNQQVDCDQFDFFDAFAGLDFAFLMTDTADYISYIPQMVVRAYDPDTNLEVFEGDRTPTRMIVDVTMPMTEQEKLPVFQDIEILLTARWTSSQYATPLLTEDIVFQNLLYTIKFEPIANVLFADLVGSSENVIRDETLILDASASYISNMPESQQRRSLAYQWRCPEIFEEVCASRGGSQLAIPFAEVAAIEGIIYELYYEFEVTVIWAKPDGMDVKSTLSVTASWYNLKMPDFQIDYDPAQLLITSPTNSLFYLEALNFAVDDIYDYNVEWSMAPELENPTDRSVLSGGRIMQILKGKYSKNTSYIISLTVTHKKLDKLKQTRSIEFSTLAPPVQGILKVTPSEGFIGDIFTVVLQDWTSANLPIEYNVYNTYADDRKGPMINEDGPIPVAEQFSFEATRTTPIVVTVFDASGETLEFKITLQITLPPTPPPQDPSSADTEGTDGESANTTPEGGQASPQNLLMQIQGTQSLSQRVNYLTIAIETVQTIEASGGANPVEVDVEEQVAIRSSLLAEIENQVKEIEQRTEPDPLSLSARDFITESFSMLAQLTSSPRFLDQDIVDRSSQVIHRLQQLEDGLYVVILEAERGQFRTNFFLTLENLNKFARLNSHATTLLSVRSQLQTVMDQMCTFVDLPGDVYEYGSLNGLGELGFSLFRFDRSTALNTKRGTLNALDASYDYNAYTMYNWFTTSQPGELCTQVYAQQYGEVLMNGAYLGNSQSRLQVTIYERGSNKHHSMGELSGQTIATFDIDRTTYYSNQTVCMGYSKSTQRWQSSLCQSELNVEDVSMKCTCNSFESDLIGVFSDFDRTLADPVAFPEPIVEETDSLFVAMPSNVDPTITTSGTTVSIESLSAEGSVTGSSDDMSGVVSQISDVNGTNYVWIGQTLLVSVLCAAGSLIAHKMDEKDEKRQSVCVISPISAAKQNHFIDEVAKALNEPYGSVSLRKSNINNYRTMFNNSAFPYLMAQLHPLLSPFTAYCATQSRLIRFAFYALQVNVISSLVFIYYGSIYRVSDETRNTDVIDQSDLLSVLLMTLTCSVLLTPWLSEPLTKACSSQLVASSRPNTENITQPVLVKARRIPLKRTLLGLSFAAMLLLPLWAVVASGSTPASNQYCMSTTVIGALFGSTLGTNLLYLWINSCLARKVAYAPHKKAASASSCLVHSRALRILRDMKAVLEVKDQFTLADVLPSSLECSGSEACSIHSSGGRANQVSDQSIKQIPNGHRVFDDRTVNDDAEQVEILNEMDPASLQNLVHAAGCNSEEQKELMTEEDHAQGSNRPLNPTSMPHNFDRVGSNKEASQSELSQSESQKHLMAASMIKDSMLDFDNSRNDVVPQRTLLDDEQYAAVHPAEATGYSTRKIPALNAPMAPSFRADGDSELAENVNEDDEAVNVSPNRRRLQNRDSDALPSSSQKGKIILQ